MKTDEDYNTKRSAALFLLKLREERKVTQTALNGMVLNMQEVWKDVVGQIKVIIMLQYW